MPLSFSIPRPTNPSKLEELFIPVEHYTQYHIIKLETGNLLIKV